MSLRPLIDVLPSPIGIIPQNEGIDSELFPDLGLLNRVASRLGAPAFQFSSGKSELSMFGRVVTNRLAVAENLPRQFSARADSALDIECVVDQFANRSFDHYCDRAEAISFDGVPINVYAARDPKRKAVVIASVCGMPAKLTEAWIRFLAREYFVITWETRGLFGRSRALEDLDCSVAAQAADAFAAMDHFRVRKAHFMGMCGGAIMAL